MTETEERKQERRRMVGLAYVAKSEAEYQEYQRVQIHFYRDRPATQALLRGLYQLRWGGPEGEQP